MSAPPTYTVVHGHRSIQLATDRIVIPPEEVASFTSAMQCAHSLEVLLVQEEARIAAALAEAHHQGLELGRREAAASAQRELAQALAGLSRRWQMQEAAMRQAVGTLALAVVGKLSATLGAAHIVPALVEQTVRDLLPQRALRVRVPPGLVAVTRQSLETAGLGTEVRADEALSGFDCEIDSPKGQQMAGLGTQLAAVARAIDASAPATLEG